MHLVDRSAWIDTTFVWSPIVPLYLLFGLVVGLTWVSLWSVRQLSWKQRSPILCLRLLAVGLLSVMMAQPSRVRTPLRKVAQRLAVIIDDSESMALPSSQGSRLATVQKFLMDTQGLQKSLLKDIAIDFFDLAGEPVRELQDLSARRTQTHLIDSLEALERRHPGGTWLGVLLFSDGADSVLSAPESLAGGLTSDIIKRLRAQNTPVTCVLPEAQGAEAKFDVSVAPISADGFALVHNSLTLSTRVKLVGKKQVVTHVSLFVDGEKKESKSLLVTSEKETPVSFQVKPDAVGEVLYTVFADPLPDELTDVNNHQTRVVQVSRDKIRVLLVAGRPSWDEKFLRQYLKESANVDLVSFFILRTPSDATEVPESELSLIPFPVQKIFTSELKNFDVLVLANFDFRPYQMAHYLPNVRDAVYNGLGLVMLGGEESFGSGGYAGTPIADIIPLMLPKEEPDQAFLDQASRRASLTPAALAHPIFKEAQASLQDTLPFLEKTNVTLGTHAGATLLASGRRAAGDGPVELPLIAVMQARKGRSFAIASDQTWRWRFGAVEAGSADFYKRMWEEALRWLSHDPEHAHLHIVALERTAPKNVARTATIQLTGADYLPHARAAVRFDLEELTSNGAHPVFQEIATTDAEGAASATLPPLQTGSYRLRVTEETHTPERAQAEASLVATPVAGELEDTRLYPEVLQKVAQTTGGTLLPLTPRLWHDFVRRDLPLAPNLGAQIESLWDHPLLFGLLIVCWSLCWGFTRRAGHR